MMPLNPILGGVSLQRRKFITTAAAATTAACSRQPNLSEAQMRTLDAWVDALIPEDHDAGARSAGVIHFIDIQLSGKYKKYRSLYRTALDAVDRLSDKAPFHELSLEERTAILQKLETGYGPSGVFADGGKAAFEMILAHTMQGFYGDPRHGGNRNYVSWKMIGVPPMPVRGRLHYEVKS